MDKNATGHFRLQWMTVILVAFAVFSWGVQYKLSLYNFPVKTIAATPQAKLLSQKERHVAIHESMTGNVSGDLQRIPRYFCAFIGLIAAFSLARTLRKLVSKETSEFVPLEACQYLTYFSFRPPPFATISL